MAFDFSTPERIVFGIGCIQELPNLVHPWGRRALVVVGQSMSRVGPHMEALARSGMHVTPLQVDGEPTVARVREGAALARRLESELIIGIGGGSVIDTGKAVAALASNSGDPVDYLEVIGSAKPLPNPPLPFAAVPTTAGTGSEATRNAVLTSPQHRVKVSLRSPLLWPRLALVDPSLSVGLPPDLTAATGLDALTQLLEAFVSVRANPMTDILCRDSLPRVASALPRAFEDGTCLEARSDLALGALHSGMALANAGLGAVHGLAGPLGGQCGAPHGALCAALLAPVTGANIQALRQRAPESHVLKRYAEVSRWIGANQEETAESLVGSLQRLVSQLRIPSLANWGITAADLEEPVRKAQESSSMKGNPIRLTESELHGVLTRAL
jgi:alcohol dehydrogenase class IV